MHTPHFSRLRESLHAVLHQARQEMQIAVAWFTDATTASLLAQKSSEGVRIEVFIVDDQINERLDMSAMEAAGVRLTRIPAEDGLLHFKFCIVDGRMLVYGSANWTYAAFSHNREQITVVEDDPEFIARFQAEFTRLRARFGTAETPKAGLAPPPERLALQQEIRLLEAILAETETQLIEVETTLARFRQLYQHLLGDLLREVLRLRAALAQRKANLTQKPEDKQAAQAQQQRYTDFTQERLATAAPLAAKPETKKDLHRMFREAVKYCHPDKVEDAFREVAQAVFVQLKAAFDAQDSEAVRQILEELQHGIAWNTPTEQITDLDTLRRLRDKRKKQVSQKQAALQDVLANSSYIEITNAPDWETFIDNQRPALEHERDTLQEELRRT